MRAGAAGAPEGIPCDLQAGSSSLRGARTRARRRNVSARACPFRSRFNVLVIDDFAIAPVTDMQRADLLELLEDRYGARATIVTSQLDPTLWHDYLAEPTLADAICDGLLNNAHRLALKGPSGRKEEPSKKKETEKQT